MFNTSTQLVLDIKAQDRLREWFSQRGSSNNVVVTCLGLGDSDIDYELFDQVGNIQIVSAPYNVQQIKHKLIFKGSESNFVGKITSFKRYVESNGDVDSLYGFPPNGTDFTFSTLPPTLVNGFDFSNLVFLGGANTTKEGYIVFLQTLPDNYFDTSGVALRFIEPYEIVVENLPPPIVISNVTNANPAKVTAVGHGRSSGDEIVLSNVAMNSDLSAVVNGTFFIDNIVGDTFDLYADEALTLSVDSTSIGAYLAGAGKVTTWEVLIDQGNGSFLIAKTKIDLQGFSNGKIKIRGLLSGTQKELTFNY